MKYKVIISERAKKEFKKLDRPTYALIIGWIRKNLQDSENPRQFGKSLIGDRKGQWRYRIGNYRLICEINDRKIIILVLEVGHRRNIYN